MVSNPYSPRSGDEKLARGGVMIDKVARAAGAAPEETVLTIAGSLPTPCHELRLRIPQAPSPDGVIRIEAWSLADPDRVCAQVLTAFSVQVRTPAAEGKIAINGALF
jgi:hypothetical protein